HEDIADATFNDLGFDRRHPAAAKAAIGTEGVYQDAGDAGVVLAAVPSPLTPFELNDQVVIAVGLLGDQPTPAVTGDVQQAVFDREHLTRIFAASVFDVRVEPVEILAIEQLDRLVLGADRHRLA